MVIFYILSFLEHKAFIWRIPAACTNFLSVHYAPLSNENLTASCICLFFAFSQALFFGVLGLNFLYFSRVLVSSRLIIAPSRLPAILLCSDVGCHSQHCQHQALQSVHLLLTFVSEWES